MPVEITELTFLEQLAGRHRIPVPEHVSGDAPAKELRSALERWGGEAIVKADVLAGKRGKGGAVKKISDFIEVQRAIKQIGNAEIGGRLPRGAYAVQFIPAEAEAYSAITYDSRSLGPMLTVSMKGGMDIEEVDESDKVHLAVDVFKGLDAYQASEVLERLECPKNAVSKFSRALVNLWDLFSFTGMRMCEVNPWRITAAGDAVACDFKAVFDDANFKFKNLGLNLPDYPAVSSAFEEEMAAWNAASHQGQAHVSDLGGKLILPILFGGGASTIICETLENAGGSPIFLSDFGGNPPYERMYGTAKICFDHNLKKAGLLLVLGGKANNTLIDVTFQAIGDALAAHCEEHGTPSIPVVVGRGGPHLVQGLISLRNTLEQLGMPYVIFGPDTPVTLVAEYAARLVRVLSGNGGGK
ncbi:MAG: ATP-grasp domain-containing protein [Planctomycetota bacterium]|jgi:succinyl-CoA synthetase beta subunit